MAAERPVDRRAAGFVEGIGALEIYLQEPATKKRINKYIHPCRPGGGGSNDRCFTLEQRADRAINFDTKGVRDKTKAGKQDACL